MKLSAAESVELVAGLIAAFPSRDKLARIIAAPPAERLMARIVVPGTLDSEYFQLVQAANEEGWIDRLLAGLQAADGVNPALLALIGGFVGLRPPASVPPHMELLLDGTPFVNQHPLRHALLSITQPNGPKVLQVTGQPASGKTYSQYLIAHVGRRMGAEVYLAPAIEATTTAREVVEDIALNMDLGQPPVAADAPQDSTAVTRLVRWLAAAGRRLDRDWWLVFDGFDGQQVDDSVLMLMHGMAQTVGLGQPDRIRLFLLAWDRAISGPPPGRVFEQRLMGFDRSHVKDFIDELVRQFAMPKDMGSTDEIMTLCYEGWDGATDPQAKAVTLTMRLQQIAQAALAAKAGT